MTFSPLRRVMLAMMLCVFPASLPAGVRPDAVQQVHSYASQAKADADALVSFVRNPGFDKALPADPLYDLREQVNGMGRLLPQVGDQYTRAAIVGLADTTQATLDKLSTESGPVLDYDLGLLAEDLYGRASRLADATR